MSISFKFLTNNEKQILLNILYWMETIKGRALSLYNPRLASISYYGSHACQYSSF